MQSQAMGPSPDSQFILTNQPVQRPQPLTTSTKAGKAAIARKRKLATQKNDGEGAKKKSRATKKSANNQSEGAST